MNNLKPSSTYQSIIGQVIVKIRKKKSIEQLTLATAVGVTQSTWSRIEQGSSTLSVEQLILVSKALDIKASEILQEAEIAIQNLQDQNVDITTLKDVKNNDKLGAFIGAAALGALVAAALLASDEK